jgi:hypothetical protein
MTAGTAIHFANAATPTPAAFGAIDPDTKPLAPPTFAVAAPPAPLAPPAPPAPVTPPSNA